MIRKPSFVSLLALAALAVFCLGAGPATPPSPSEDGTLPALTAIAGQGMMNNHAYHDLEELSDQIGGRVTGSPEAQQALAWGVEKMKAMGLENVRVEKWTMSHGWKRVSAEAELLARIHRRLSIDSMGWVGSTAAGGAEAEVVPVNINQLDQEMKENASKWAGKVLMVVRKGEPPKDAIGTFAKFGSFLKAA